MPLDPRLGNSPQPPATINAGNYPPVEYPGEPLVAFGNLPNKPKSVKPGMQSHPGKKFPGVSVRPRPAPPPMPFPLKKPRILSP